MKLSILIRSIESRKDKLKDLLNNLYGQMVDLNCFDDVQILVELDNKQITSGEKANRLLAKSIGQYIIFIDDDDYVYPYYIEELLKACESGADCFATNGYYSVDGGGKIKWRLSKDYQDRDVYENGELIYLRRTNHITAVKREIAIAFGFPNKSNAEDKWYSERLVLNSEYKIEPPMYWYKYSSQNKEYA